MVFEVTRINTPVANAYLITGERVALVDTASRAGYNRVVKALQKKGLEVEDVEFILITHHHFDHVANAAEIKRVSGATVIAGLGDVPYVEGKKETPPPSGLNRIGRIMRRFPRSLLSYQEYDPVVVDRPVKDGDVIEELGLEVVGLPGHTTGGVAYLDREGRRAFIGDMVSAWFGKVGLPTLSASESYEEIIASQKRIAELDLDIAYPGHGVVLEPGASEMIKDFVLKKAPGA